MSRSSPDRDGFHVKGFQSGIDMKKAGQLYLLLVPLLKTSALPPLCKSQQRRSQHLMHIQKAISSF